MARKRKDTIKSANLAVDNWARGSEVSANKKIALVSSSKRKEWESTQNVVATPDPTRVRLTVLKFTPKDIN